MNKIFIFIVGIVTGVALMFFLSNRYTPMTVYGESGRMDQITGEACVFGKPSWTQETYEFVGMGKCD